jgi:CheY-like chemotaxis protein
MRTPSLPATKGYAGLSITDSLKVLSFLQHIEETGTKYFPAVILLDLMMPQLSGYELAAQLTQHPSYAHIPIIIMTADYRVRTVSAVPGAVDLLSKPFPFKALLSKVKRYLTPNAVRIGYNTNQCIKSGSDRERGSEPLSWQIRTRL